MDDEDGMGWNVQRVKKIRNMDDIGCNLEKLM